METKQSYFKRGLGLFLSLLLLGVLGNGKPLSGDENVDIPGTIIKEMYDKELNVYQYVLSNNVRINLKPMGVLTYDGKRIMLRASFGRGELETPPGLTALPFVADLFLTKGGLQVNTDKIASLYFSVDLDDFSFTGTASNQKGLESLLYQMRAYFTVPVYHEEVMDEVHNSLDKIYSSLYQTPQGLCKDKVERLLASGDWKFGYPPKDDAMKITVEQIRTFLEKPLKDSYLEISIVGDFNVQECLKVILQTIGKLPKRDDSRPYLEELRNIHFPKTPLKETFWIENERHPTAYVMIVWPTVDGWNPVKARQLDVLAEIFNERLRWYLGDIIKPHTPCVKNCTYLCYKNYGKFMVYSHTQPSRVDEVQRAFVEIVLNLRAGIGEEEFRKAITYILKEVDLIENQLNYWLKVINRSQEHPVFLEWARTFKITYGNIRKEEVEVLANQYLHPQKAITIKILPPLKNNY